MRSRNDLGQFLNRRGLLGSGVEVGAARGDFSRVILDSWQGQRIYLVDCWTPQDKFDYQDIHNVDQPRHEQNFSHLQSHLKPHEGRYEIVRAFSRDAALRFADASLDFVYIDANHKYPFIAEDLRLWWPKVKPGGMLAGMGYIDAVVADCLFGVKTAVDEFAREHHLAACLTYDKLASWFFFKPGSPVPPAPQVPPVPPPAESQSAPFDAAPATPPRKLGILTAYDQPLAPLAQWAVPNKQRYCDLRGYNHLALTSGFDAFRPPAWSKVKFLREHLPRFDWLFWSDIDSLITNYTIRLEDLIDDHYDLVITMEDPGVGVYNLSTRQLLFRNTDWSLRFLDEIYAQTQFIDSRLWEQRALIHLWEKSDLSEHIKVVAQKSFNSYPNNWQKGDFVLHFPDAPMERRKYMMRLYQQFVVEPSE
jgi:hypothetical protein